MTIGDRIKEVRYRSRGPDGKKLTLEQFGERIGLKRSTVSALETGAQGVTDQTIMTVCREFGVSEQWLRYGEGEMMIRLTAEERIANLIAEAQTGPPHSLKRRMLSAISKLDDEDWVALARIAEKITSKNE